MLILFYKLQVPPDRLRSTSGTVCVCREADTRGAAPDPNRSGEACTLRSRQTLSPRALFLITERTSRAERTQVTCPCADFAASRDTSPCASQGKNEIRPRKRDLIPPLPQIFAFVNGQHCRFTFGSERGRLKTSKK